MGKSDSDRVEECVGREGSQYIFVVQINYLSLAVVESKESIFKQFAANLLNKLKLSVYELCITRD